jgi:P-type Ca2+ transporter type 2C
MLDPKNIDDLTSFGGSAGLMRGLGTTAETGLTTPGAPPPATQPDTSTEKVPDVVLTTPDGDVGAAHSAVVPTETVVATYEDRQRVFGSNTLPTRPSKTLLQLMWMALKDKVLVSHCSGSISDTLGLISRW